MLPGFSQTQVLNRLALLSRRPVAQLAGLFAGAPVCLQEQLEGEQALAYCQRLAEAGAQADVYHQDAPVSAESLPLPLIGVVVAPRAPVRQRLSGVLGVLLAAMLLLLAVLLPRFPAVPVSPPEVWQAPETAVRVPAMRRFYLPDTALPAMSDVLPSPPSPVAALAANEIDWQSSWWERLKTDIKLIKNHKVNRRILGLPKVTEWTRLVGELPDLLLQAEAERILLHIPAQQKALEQGAGRLEWQGLSGDLQPLASGWQLQVASGELKLAALSQGWLSLGAAQLEAELQADLLPRTLHLRVPLLELSDGADRTLRLQPLQVQLAVSPLADSVAPLLRGELDSQGLLWQQGQQHLRWTAAWLLITAQAQKDALNYGVHLRLDEVQSFYWTALESAPVQVQATLLLRQLTPTAWTAWATRLQHSQYQDWQFARQDLPPQVRAHLALEGAQGHLEIQFTLNFNKTMQQLPKTWQDWAEFVDLSLDVEASRQWLEKGWQAYQSTQTAGDVPWSYLRTQGYVRTQGDNDSLHLRWQDGQLFLNETRIGSYADYQLLQQQRPLAEAFSLLAGLQGELEDYYQDQGRFPPNLALLGGQSQGAYTESIWLDRANLALVARLKSDPSLALLAGVQIRLSFLPQSGRWHCHAEQIPEQAFLLLPSECQN